MTNRAESTYRNPERTLKRIKMIKICYIIGQLTMGGAEKQLFQLVRSIDKKKFQPVVISLSEDGFWAEEIRKIGIQVMEIRRHKSKEFNRLIKLIKFLRKEKPDIVHTYLFSANTYGRIAAILAKIPVIIASERNAGEMGKDKNRYMIYIDKILSLFSDGIICNSLHCSNNLITKYSFDVKKVFIVHNGINGNDYLGESRCSSSTKSLPKVIGTIGGLNQKKNHKLFLSIAKAVLDMSENKNIKFLVIGDGPLKKELETHSKHLGIGDNVIFTGERTDIPELLHSMDIFVMTSSYEGLSNTIMEAMSAGLPVIATNVGGNSELIVNGESGFLCASNNAIVFSEKVLSLINNEDKARQMGEHGKRRIEEEFGVERMVSETETIYNNIVKQKSALLRRRMFSYPL